MAAKLTVGKVVNGIGRASNEWIGNCYSIACQIVDVDLVKGRAVYGHYLGFVHPKAQLFGKSSERGWQRHGWIVTDKGDVVDPTRWVFENKRPYIYYGALDLEEYDEGGSQLRKALLRPCPEYNPDNAIDFSFDNNAITDEYLMLMGNPDEFWCFDQIFWVANLPYDAHSDAKAAYTALAQHNFIALVPLDYRLKCEADFNFMLDTNTL